MNLVGSVYNKPVVTWSYAQSFKFGIILVLAGFMIEITGISIPKIPVFPYNLYLGIILINVLVVTYLLFPRNVVVRWLMSVPSSVSAVFYYLLLALLMGFISQEDSGKGGWIEQLGLNRIVSSWPFLFAQLYFLVTLGMVTLKRTIPFKVKNWGFIVNHLGLWVVVFAASLGSADLRRWTISVMEGQTTTTAYDQEGMTQELPFALELIDFDIIEYPSKVVLAEKYSSKIVASVLLPKDSISALILKNWQLQIYKGDEDNYKVVAEKTGVRKEGHLSIKGMRPALLDLNEEEALAIMPPEPQKYISTVQLQNGINNINTDIMVNQPVNFAGWDIYQLSYDTNAGKSSRYSIFEVIYDPWLPVVYTGLVMLVIGAVYLIWAGKFKKI